MFLESVTTTGLEGAGEKQLNPTVPELEDTPPLFVGKRIAVGSQSVIDHQSSTFWLLA